MASPAVRPMPWRACIGVMGNVSLAEYTRECLPETTEVKGLFCNSTGMATKPPILRRGVPNTIIVFPGRFNPPCIHHTRLLRHVVRNADQDLNIIAAVIYLVDQAEVQEFVGQFGYEWDVFRSADQRRDVFVGLGIPVDGVWVLSREQCDWSTLSSLLKERALQDGLNLQFLLLCGPEYFPVGNEVYPEGPEDPAKWGCTGCITSDICRAADFVYESIDEPTSDSLGCTRWRRVVTKAKDVRAIAKAKFMVNGHEDLEGVTQGQIRDEMRRIAATAARDWTCSRREYPWGCVHFVAAPLRPRTREFCTEDIRCTVKRTAGSENLAGTELELAPFALNVRCLLTFAAEWRDQAFDDEVGWGEWDDRVEQILAAVAPEAQNEQGVSRAATGNQTRRYCTSQHGSREAERHDADA